MKRKFLRYVMNCGIVIMLVVLIYASVQNPEQIEEIARAFLLFFEAISKVVQICGIDYSF